MTAVTTTAPAVEKKATEPDLKLTTNQTVLAAALKEVLLAIPRRVPVPILAGVVIEGHGNYATLSTFDYEIAVTHNIPASGVGKVIVTAHTLNDLVKDLAKGCDITISMQGNICVLEGDGVTYSLLSLPIDDYPSLPAPKTRFVGTLDADDLVSLLDLAQFAGRDQTLPILTMVKFEVDADGTITAYTTDRYRLGRLAITPDDNGAAEPGEATNFLVPAPALIAMAKAYKGARVSLGIGKVGTVGPGYAVFAIDLAHANSRRIIVRQGDGDYPKVTALWPSATAVTTTVESAALIKGIKQVAKVLRRNMPIHLSSDDEAQTVNLTAADGLDARAHKGVPASVTNDTEGGGPFRTAFNPQYLLDVVDGCGGTCVVIQQDAVAKPAVFTNPERPDFSVLLMPVRIAG